MAGERGNPWRLQTETDGLEVHWRRGRDGHPELRVRPKPGYVLGVGQPTEWGPPLGDGARLPALPMLWAPISGGMVGQAWSQIRAFLKDLPPETTFAAGPFEATGGKYADG